MAIVVKGQFAHKQALHNAFCGVDGGDVEHGPGLDATNFRHLLDHGRQRHRAQTFEQLVLKLEGHTFGQHRGVGQDLQLVGAKALRVQGATQALSCVHKKRRLVQTKHHAWALRLHAQLPAIGLVVFALDFAPGSHQSFGGVLPAQRDALV